MKRFKKLIKNYTRVDLEQKERGEIITITALRLEQNLHDMPLKTVYQTQHEKFQKNVIYLRVNPYYS